MDQFYQNSGYINKRNRKQILILDVDDSGAGDTHLGTGGEFNISLFEPLIIDSLSEVYLDNFISFNSNISNITANSAFVLKIDQFNINSNVASSTNKNTIFNSIVIPNEHSSVANNHGVVLHKAKKFNYICDINPGKISNISGNITNLAGDPIFHGNSSSFKFTYTLSGIVKDTNPKGVISNGDTATITETGSTLTLTGATTCIFLATHDNNSSSLHFATDLELAFDASNAGTIIFTFDGVTNRTIDQNPTTNNPSLFLTQSDARFVAEFSINSRE